MKLINVIYDYEYDDIKDVLFDIGAADIVSVPDYVYDNLEAVVQEFFNWTEDEVRKSEKSKFPEYWTKLPNGQICFGFNSSHFIKWINDNYFHYENQASIVVKIDTTFNPEYPAAKF